MKEPPDTIDHADVLYWAWSDTPIFVMPSSNGSGGITIHGLAICMYPSGEVHRFSCNHDWQTENDSLWETFEEAMTVPSTQDDLRAIEWREKVRRSR